MSGTPSERLMLGARPRHPEAKIVQHTLRRRDNLEDFIDGVVETELFPYPDGQYGVVPATMVPVQDITWKPEAFLHLTVLKFHNVQCQLGGVDKHVNVTMTLTPSDGVGTFELDVEVVKEKVSDEDDLIPEKDLQSVRMAMWARYEWVVEKVQYLNFLRWECERKRMEEAMGIAPDRVSSSDVPHAGTEGDEDVISDISEEVDPYDSDVEFSTDSEDCDENENNDPVVFPDAKKLSELDMGLLRQLFEREELESLHNTIRGQHESLDMVQHSSSLGADSGYITDSPKRRRQDEDMTIEHRRSRAALIESIRNSFFVLAKTLPDEGSTGEAIREFRTAAGGLHLTARLLELDGNLKHANLPEPPPKKPKQNGGEKESSTESGTPEHPIDLEPRYVPLGSEPLSATEVSLDGTLEGRTALSLVQSQYVETQVDRVTDDEYHHDMEALRDAELLSDSVTELLGVEAGSEGHPSPREAEELMQSQLDMDSEDDWLNLRESILAEEEGEQTLLYAYSDVPELPELAGLHQDTQYDSQ